MNHVLSFKPNENHNEAFAEMFAQCWRALNANFYDPKHHDTNWTAIREKFLPLVAHTATREDLYALVSMMLGELNASHLGISGRAPTPDDAWELERLFSSVVLFPKPVSLSLQL